LKHSSPTISDQLLRQWCIALTGGIASGKSAVADILRSKGFLVIDADDLARRVIAPGQPALEQIRKAFPNEPVIAVDGSLDRKAMRDLAFKDKDARTRLEAITHPAIRKTLLETLRKAGFETNPEIFFYEAALVFEKGLEGDFREIWVMECPEETQIERLAQLRGISPGDARRIIAAQIQPAERKKRASKVIHRIIDTSGDREKTLTEVESALAALGGSSLSSR
jgi:dephospho-CoA kinase